MNFKIKTFVAAVAVAASSLASAQTLLNASYDVAREFYKDVNAAFIPAYKKSTGKDVKVDQSHAGSSAQARAVADGLDADVVTMNTSPTWSSWPRRAWSRRTGPSAFPTTHRPPPPPC